MPNRTLCQVLEEMRKCVDTLNFAYLAGLIEEAQSMGNRMEAALYDKENLNYYRDRLKDLKDQVEDAERVRNQLREMREEKKSLERALKKVRHEYQKETRGDVDRCDQCGETFLCCGCNR